MFTRKDECTDPVELLHMAQRTYVHLHAKLQAEVERLSALTDPRKRRAAEAAARLEAFQEEEPDEAAVRAAKLAADVAKEAREEAKALHVVIANHQRAIEQVKKYMAELDAMAREGGDAQDDSGELDVESARREILGELARLAAAE